MDGATRISVVIVSYNSAAELRRTLPPLVGELGEEDELIVADNGSRDDSLLVVDDLAPGARVLPLGGNLGFAAACNAAAERAGRELLVILNPDASPEPGWGEAIRRPHAEGRGWDAWMALVAYEGASRINTAGNPVHFTGFSWAGDHGRPLADSPSAPREVPVASGACLALPLAVWRETGGFPADYFLYHEDTDLSLRLHLHGGGVGIEPDAVVDHDYVFEATAEKWRWLERNRWSMLIRVYPAALLVLVMPALLLTELALIPVAAAGGWLGQKAAAWRDVIRRLPRLLRERREIQSRPRVSTAEFASWLTADLDSPFFGALGRSPVVRGALRAYWRVVTFLVGDSHPRQPH